MAACNAAVAMHGAVAAASRGQVQIRVGLNTGVVLVRSVGFDMSLGYDAIGISVHMAARMEQFAPPGSTIISDSTYREVEGCVETEPLGRQTFKGAPLPVVVHRLISVITETRWEGRVARHLTPFTGRERELAQLQAVINAANAGASKIVTIVGEPGIGKSRLLHELLQASDMSAWTTLRTGSAANQLNSEYFAVGKLLREWMAQGGDPDLASALRHRLPDLNQNGASTFAALSYLLGSTVADEDWLNLEPKTKRRRAVEAFRYFVSAIGSTRPLAIVIEDLHWIDDASREIFEDLASHLGTGRICIIGTTRNEESAGPGPNVSASCWSRSILMRPTRYSMLCWATIRHSIRPKRSWCGALPEPRCSWKKWRVSYWSARPPRALRRTTLNRSLHDQRRHRVPHRPAFARGQVAATDCKRHRKRVFPGPVGIPCATGRAGVAGSHRYIEGLRFRARCARPGRRCADV